MDNHLIIVPKDREAFTRSQCSCNFCLRTHLAQEEWGGFEIKTHLQRRIKNIVNKIEYRLSSNTRKK